MMGKHIRTCVWILLAVYLVYTAVSCIVPPLFQKNTDEAFTPVSMTQCTAPGASPERVRCLDGNQEALVSRLQVIASAQKELIFTTFSLLEDESGLDIMAALREAARRGVHVRILVDGVNAAKDLNFSSAFFALQSEKGVEVRCYNPVNLLLPWRLNYRMHDKYLIADDQVYILGGRNSRNVSLGNYQQKHDQDRDLLVYCKEPRQDSSICQVKDYFEAIWNASCTKIFVPHASHINPGALQDRMEQLQKACPEGFEIPDWEQITVPANRITLLANPIDARNKVPELWAHLLSLMGEGREVTVQSPYLIFNGSMYQQLQELCRERKVEILTNSPLSGANICGCADYMNQRRNIHGIGADIYEVAAEHSVHTKSIVIDDRISIVGSFNFDMRSAYLDTEMMLVVDSPELNAHIRQMNEGYMRQSLQIGPEGQTAGSAYQEPELSVGKRVLYGVLRVLILPIRQVL